MNEISLAAPRTIASRARGIPTDEGELWAALCAEARRAAAREEVLRGFLDQAVQCQPGFELGAQLAVGAQTRRAFAAGRRARRHHPHRDG